MWSRSIVRGCFRSRNSDPFVLPWFGADSRLSQQLDTVHNCLQQKSCKSASSQSFFRNFPAPILPGQKWTQGENVSVPLQGCGSSFHTLFRTSREFLLSKVAYQKRLGRVWSGGGCPIKGAQNTWPCDFLPCVKREQGSFSKAAVQAKSGKEMKNNQKRGRLR